MGRTNGAKNRKTRARREADNRRTTMLLPQLAQTAGRRSCRCGAACRSAPVGTITGLRDLLVIPLVRSRRPLAQAILYRAIVPVVLGDPPERGDG